MPGGKALGGHEFSPLARAFGWGRFLASRDAELLPPGRKRGPSPVPSKRLLLCSCFSLGLESSCKGLLYFLSESYSTFIVTLPVTFSLC